MGWGGVGWGWVAGSVRNGVGWGGGRVREWV